MATVNAWANVDAWETSKGERHCRECGCEIDDDDKRIRVCNPCGRTLEKKYLAERTRHHLPSVRNYPASVAIRELESARRKTRALYPDPSKGPARLDGKGLPALIKALGKRAVEMSEPTETTFEWSHAFCPRTTHRDCDGSPFVTTKEAVTIVHRESGATFRIIVGDAQEERRAARG
jgi:hypothetical protein